MCFSTESSSSEIKRRVSARPSASRSTNFAKLFTFTAEEGQIGELEEEEEEGEPAIGEAVERAGEDAPSIICTSLVGAKGLSGGYVYIVGCNDTHFPRDPNAVTDEEVCCFLVALSRTRKECHLISCNNFSGIWMQPSRFVGWVQHHVDEVLVSAEWFNAN